MPDWLSHLLIFFNETGVTEGKQILSLSEQWQPFTEEQWVRLDYRVRSVCVREAMSFFNMRLFKRLGVCKQIIDLCDRAGRGEIVALVEWSEARALASGKGLPVEIVRATREPSLVGSWVVRELASLVSRKRGALTCVAQATYKLIEEEIRVTRAARLTVWSHLMDEDSV
jgi:hypothetical protein